MAQYSEFANFVATCLDRGDIRRAFRPARGVGVATCTDLVMVVINSAILRCVDEAGWSQDDCYRSYFLEVPNYWDHPADAEANDRAVIDWLKKNLRRRAGNGRVYWRHRPRSVIPTPRLCSP